MNFNQFKRVSYVGRDISITTIQLQIKQSINFSLCYFDTMSLKSSKIVFIKKGCISNNKKIFERGDIIIPDISLTENIFIAIEATELIILESILEIEDFYPESHYNIKNITTFPLKNEEANVDLEICSFRSLFQNPHLFATYHKIHRGSHVRHYHNGKEEAIYCIKGEGVVEIITQKKEEVFIEGSILFFESGKKGLHKIKNLSPTLEFFCISSPGKIDRAVYMNSEKNMGNSIEKFGEVGDPDFYMKFIRNTGEEETHTIGPNFLKKDFAELLEKYWEFVK